MQPPVFALYCKNMKVYVQQYCALGRQYLLIKSIYMMAENAAHNRRSIDEKQTTGGARMIAIIDYDAGNIKSVEKALHYLGEETVVSRDPQVLLSADKVILPGVGSFGDAMNNLNKFGLVPVIRELTEKGTPFLGICLALHLLFESIDETPGVE